MLFVITRSECVIYPLMSEKVGNIELKKYTIDKNEQ